MQVTDWILLWDGKVVIKRQVALVALFMVCGTVVLESLERFHQAITMLQESLEELVISFQRCVNESLGYDIKFCFTKQILIDYLLSLLNYCLNIVVHDTNTFLTI